MPAKKSVIPVAAVGLIAVIMYGQVPWFRTAMDNFGDVIAGKADSGIPDSLKPGGGIDIPTAGPRTTKPQTSTPGTGTSGTTPASSPSATAAQARLAQQNLGTLTVKGKAPMTGYDRLAQFGQAWTDDNTNALGHNGCDTRNDILARDLSDKKFKPGTRDCVVLTGNLADKYTGKQIPFQRGTKTSSAVQIDHVVALGNVWVSGGQQMTQEQRVNIANDPINLYASDGPTNGAKGDSNAAEWLPPNKSFRCEYVTSQILVKAKYGLAVTAPEKDAMARVLAGC
ncbi:MAG: HNH endonuclease family protein [Nakamurella sp.]